MFAWLWVRGVVHALSALTELRYLQAKMHSHRTLRSFTSHLVPAASGSAVEPSVVDATARGRPGAGLNLLTSAQVKDFVTQGFCCVQVDEHPTVWHETAYAKAKTISEDTGHNQHILWAQMTPEINSVIQSASVRGALTSLLGTDYLFSGGCHCHVSGAGDQQHHKDGTANGVRKHEPAGVICMYYPTETTVEMGATCIVPESQYFSVNREGWTESEDQLANGSLIRNFVGPKTGERSLEQWRQVRAASGSIGKIQDDDAREAALAECIANLGMDPSSQKRMVVPAGSFLIMHRDVYHRGARSWPGAKWRPML